MANPSKAGVIIRTLLLLALLGVGGAAAYLRLSAEKPLDVTVAPAQRGPVTETVASITTGVVTSPKSSKIAAGTLGIIAGVLVSDGDRVEAGQPLVELVKDELEAQVRAAAAGLEVGRTRVAQAKIAARTAREGGEIRLRQAKDALAQAEADVRRVRALAERKAVSDSDLEKAELALRQAGEMKSTAEVGLAEADVRDEDVRTAEAAVAQLEAALAAAETMRDKATVRAPFKGVVAKVMTQAGEAVVMGMPLLFLVQEEGLYIEAPFDEANLSMLKTGQRVQIEIDAVPGREFKGTLTHISPVVTAIEQLARNVLCKISIDEGAGSFRPGMSADVSVVVQEKADALVVPSESLIRDEYVYVIEGGRIARRDVEAGIGNWDHREILSGLRAGEEVVTSVSVLGLAEGALVRVVEALED